MAAGFAGIGAAIQLKRLGYEDFVILEREADLGGTWYVNHYPGPAVDVPTTTYSYFFEPNPNWSRLFCTGPEIKQYADDVADKYDVRRHIRYNTSVQSARWDEDAAVWHVTPAGGDPLTAVPAAHPGHPRRPRFRRNGGPHRGLGRQLRPARPPYRRHRHARSYYFNPSGEATLLRPTSTRTAIREASTYPVTDYHFS